MARLIETCGCTTTDGTRNFENHGIPLSLRSLKTLEGLVGPFLAQCAPYMETPRAMLLGWLK